MHSEEDRLLISQTVGFFRIRIFSGLGFLECQEIHELKFKSYVVWRILDDDVQPFLAKQLFRRQGRVTHELSIFKIDRAVRRRKQLEGPYEQSRKVDLVTL